MLVARSKPHRQSYVRLAHRLRAAPLAESDDLQMDLIFYQGSLFHGRTIMGPLGYIEIHPHHFRFARLQNAFLEFHQDGERHTARLRPNDHASSQHEPWDRSNFDISRDYALRGISKGPFPVSTIDRELLLNLLMVTGIAWDNLCTAANITLFGSKRARQYFPHVVEVNRQALATFARLFESFDLSMLSITSPQTKKERCEIFRLDRLGYDMGYGEYRPYWYRMLRDHFGPSSVLPPIRPPLPKELIDAMGLPQFPFSRQKAFFFAKTFYVFMGGIFAGLGLLPLLLKSTASFYDWCCFSFGVYTVANGLFFIVRYGFIPSQKSRRKRPGIVGSILDLFFPDIKP